MDDVVNPMDLEGVAPDVPCDRYSEEGWSKASVYVPREMEFTIYVNHEELVTILCSPTKLNCLVVGFLYTEGIITHLGDVASMRVCKDDALADVMLSKKDFSLPTRRILTSGCGGGASFRPQGEKVASPLKINPADILTLMKKFQGEMGLYRLSGGIHASALADSRNILVLAEDIGRHNTFDKILGECLLRKMETKDRLLLSTGRVSSEMLLKAAKMQIPIVVSHTSPTERAILYARELGVTLIGYARAKRMLVYTHPERLIDSGRKANEVMKSGKGA